MPIKARQLFQCYVCVTLSEEFTIRKRKRLGDVNSIASSIIPRWLGVKGSFEVMFELHNFLEALESGYSAVNYLRVTDGDTIHLGFVMGKYGLNQNCLTLVYQKEVT